MKKKNWALLALAMLIGCYALLSAVVIYIDPFQVYRLAKNYVPPIDNTTQVYSNAGIARNYDYDSAIVGTSMTECFKATLLSEQLGGRFIKLSTSAGTAYNHALLMELAFDTHDIKRIVYGLDIYSFIGPLDDTGSSVPFYLYDDNIFNDVQYWLNRSVIASFIPRCLKTWGQTQDETLRDSMYNWSSLYEYGPGMLYSAQFTPAQSYRAEDAYIANATANLKQHLISYIAAHPETQFNIYFPPYSAAEWATMESKGTITGLMPLRGLAYDMLSVYDNVTIHDFSAREDWVKDVNNYKDALHHGDWINDAIGACIAAGENRITSREQLDKNSALLRTWAQEQVEAGGWIY